MTERLVLWVRRRVGRQTLLSLLLLLLLFSSVVYGLADAVRGIEPGFLWPLALLGFLLGWALARSRLPGWLGVVLSLVTGGGLTILHVGELGGGLANLLEGSASALWGLARGQIPPDVVPVQIAWGELLNDFDILVARLYAWVQGLAGGRPLVDPVPIAFLWGCAVWATAAWAGWAFRRRVHALWMVAPAAALLAFALAYVGGRAIYLLPVLGSTLVLQAWLGHERRRQEWERVGVAHSSRVRSGTVWPAVGLSWALMAAAAISPSISVYRIAESVGSLMEKRSAEEMASSLGLESRPEDVPAQLSILDARRSGGLPTRHLIGSGPELAERVAMVVSVEALGQDGEPHPETLPLAGALWRGLTYDNYSARGWSTAYAVKAWYAAGDAVLSTFAPNRRLLRQQVRLVEEGSGLLFSAGSLVTADRAFQIAWRALPGDEHPGDAFGAMVDATRYRADSLLSVVGEASLRAAGEDYSIWVVERYLDLPDSLPDRVLALARDLTATEPTPYDRALAIEHYLRRFPYTLDLPSPPADQDIVDYFLFDLQTGYCDYYASAMVVLARAAGLPARLVTGYASGTYDETEGRYTITKADAHAWPEIYFPDNGWVEFEPTAGRPAIERPTTAVLEISPELEVLPEPITALRHRVRWAWWLGGAASLLFLAIGGLVAWSLADGWRLRHLPPGAAVAELFSRLYRYGPPLAARSRDGDTPREFAAALGVRVADLAGGWCWGRLLASVPGEIDWLARLCTRTLYSPHQPQAAERARAIQIWRRLRLRLWLARELTRSGRNQSWLRNRLLSKTEAQ